MSGQSLLLLLLMAMTVAGCGRQATEPAAATQSTRPAEIPAPGVLTLATRADMDAAAGIASDPAIQKAIGDRVGGSAQRWQIVAARPVGDYVLLWVSFPDVADGGVDLVYSKKERCIGWDFTGGMRG
jgi:hypothetical protein